MQKFHLVVKPCVERIFLWRQEGPHLHYLREMQRTEGDDPEHVFFNGEFDTSIAQQIATLLGNEHTTSMCFNDVFSHSLDPDQPQPAGAWQNFAVVNAPSDMYAVILQIPPALQQVLHIPPFIILGKLSEDGRKQLNKVAPLAAYGIDVEGKTFTETIVMQLPDKKGEEWRTFAEKIAKMEVNILCYTTGMYRDLSA